MTKRWQKRACTLSQVSTTILALTLRHWPELANFSAAPSSNHKSWQKQRLWPVVSARCSTYQSVVFHYVNPMGAYTPYEDSMFAGANNISNNNCTFNNNNFKGHTEAIQAISVSCEHYHCLPSTITHLIFSIDRICACIFGTHSSHSLFYFDQQVTLMIPIFRIRWRREPKMQEPPFVCFLRSPSLNQYGRIYLCSCLFEKWLVAHLHTQKRIWRNTKTQKPKK